MTDVVLVHGDTRVVVSPAQGGSLLSFQVGTRDVLRSGKSARDPRDFSHFALVPYCNRISNGVFEFEGRRVEIAPQLADEPHPLHGDGWMDRWDVAAHRDNHVELTITRPASQWPWRYRARQTVTVESGRLVIGLELANLSSEPMPAGLGFHPYFEKPGRFTATVDGWWTGAAVLPDGWDERESFRSFDVDALVADNTFTGWDGKALIDSPGGRITVSSDLNFLHVYSPKGSNFFCLEPVSAAPDALNHPERGLRVVGPGETLSATMSISVDG